MGTRSVIVKYYEKDNCFKSIYCHSDGYIEGVGSTLKQSYQEDEKIDKLIEGGDISSLNETLEHTSFYIRDWQRPARENGCITLQTDIIKEALKEILDIYDWSEYIYFFYKNEWLAYKVKFNKKRNTAKKIAV